MIPLSEIKAWLNITGTADDAQLVTLERDVVAFVEEQTHRDFGNRHLVPAPAVPPVVPAPPLPPPTPLRTEYIVGDATDVLYLEEPVVLVAGAIPSNMTVRERPWPGATGTLILATAPDGWSVRDRQLVRHGGGVWRAGWEYEIRYPFGYPPMGEPRDIRRAVLLLVEYLWTAVRGQVGIQSETIGGYSYTLADMDQGAQQIPFVRETLNRWRRVYV